MQIIMRSIFTDMIDDQMKQRYKRRLDWNRDLPEGALHNIYFATQIMEHDHDFLIAISTITTVYELTRVGALSKKSFTSLIKDLQELIRDCADRLRRENEEEDEEEED